MAAITMLSWNIEVFGPGKLGNANSVALFNYVAQVISNAGANMVSLIEVINSSAAAIIGQLIPAIDLANGHVGATDWRSVVVNNFYNHEAYVLLYQLGNNFETIPPNGAVLPAPPVSGLGTVDAAGLAIRWPSRMTQQGGRKPFFAAFNATDTGNNFSVIAYHVPDGKYTSFGIQRVSGLREITQVNDGAANHAMASSLISGDFNEYYIPLLPGPYQNLLNLPSFAAITANTSMVNFTPPGGHPTTAGYYESAYDNIFELNGGNVAGTAVDLIMQSTTMPTGTGILQAEAGAFIRAPIQNGAAIVNIPPQGFEDGWHLVRKGVSNHIPVWVTVVI